MPNLSATVLSHWGEAYPRRNRSVGSDSASCEVNSAIPLREGPNDVTLPVRMLCITAKLDVVSSSGDLAVVSKVENQAELF